MKEKTNQTSSREKGGRKETEIWNMGTSGEVASTEILYIQHSINIFSSYNKSNFISSDN